MSKPLEIIPSINTPDPFVLKEMLERCEGVVDRVSIDIVDGKFVNNKTPDPSFLSEIETALKIDYQLMVVNPIHWVEKCIRGQADRIIAHIEKMDDQVEFIAKVQGVGAGIGLAINIETPVSQLDLTAVADSDVILVMSGNVGFGGQPFDKRALAKIDELNKLRLSQNMHFRIHVDGGINETSIYNVYKKGADEVSIGRRLFSGDLAKNINKFKKIINQ